jgi:hypothetical protein
MAAQAKHTTRRVTNDLDPPPEGSGPVERSRLLLRLVLLALGLLLWGAVIYVFVQSEIGTLDKTSQTYTNDPFCTPLHETQAMTTGSIIAATCPRSPWTAAHGAHVIGNILGAPGTSHVHRPSNKKEKHPWG